MKQNIKFRIVIVAVAIVLSLWALIPTFRTLGMSLAEKQKFAQTNPGVASKAIKLGLDLQGGTHLVLEVDRAGLDPEVAKDAPDRALEVIRNRIDQFGGSEPEIRKQGENRILVQLAGVAPEQAKGLLSSTAQLEFKMVREPADVRVVLERVDGAVNRTSKFADTTIHKDSAVSRDTSKVAQDSTSKAKLEASRRDSAARVARELFGSASTDKKVSDTAKKDTAKKLAYASRPFISYLIPFGNSIAVMEDSIDRVKQILARPEAQEVLRSQETDLLWARKPVDVKSGKQVRILYVLKRRADLKGDYVADAKPSFEQG